MSEIISIAGVEVRRDEAGRYSLNDLHRASGEESRHKPGNWTALDQTKELIAEIEIAGISAIQSKQGLGTFVAKELVYAYAMWISAAFHLKVIRTFDAVVTGQAGLNPSNLSRLELIQLAMEAEQEKLALEAKVQEQAPKVRALERIASPTEGAVCLRIAAKLLQMPEKQFFQFANAEGYIFRHHHSRVWQGYAEKAKAGLVEQKFTTVTRDDGSEKTVEQVLITRLGIAKLAEKLERRNQCAAMMATGPTAGQSRHSPMQR